MSSYVLEQQFGSEIFTTAAARAVGVSQRRLCLAVHRGDLVRVRSGAYRLAGTVPDSRLDYLDRAAEVLGRHPGAALAGVSAAAAWELPCPDPWGDWDQLPITCWSPRQINRRPGLVRLSGDRGRGFSMVTGFRATDPTTTAVDVAWQLPAPQALIVVDRVARLLAGTNNRHRLRSRRLRERVRAQLLAPLAEQPLRPGSVRIRQTLQWADPAADSPPESYARGHILQAGKPAPEVNPPLTGASGSTYWMDLYWPQTGFGIEIDGAIKYKDPKVLYREKKRHDDLLAAGVRVERWIAEDVFAFAPLLVAGLG